MEKVLKKYTTIPKQLYVERGADFQLRGIIEEMQRPGYVLVARQMGKTNLLFHAKRTLENPNRLFVYVDLSNPYDNDRDCYRNIINNIIEPNIELLGSIETEIEIIREKNLPAHNEYSRCLRIILNFFKGDLVIILDEIDALKSADYSDNIFAQIRSNYFSRTNFPVFERLTYVLSGVIEPSELIKDRNKSPFNIGDKIYLDDFIKKEHDDFIIKSKLIISPEISNEIFNWANGNPRLTFDICSEIENSIMKNENVNIEMLDSIIKKKYLTTFDIAPVDHIRELVKTNQEIRKSINLIYKKSSNEISDEIKNKLYLYGIINSKFDEKTKIKNKIIELSLSPEWIKSVQQEKEISFVYGLAKYDSKKYYDAIDILENVIIDSNSSKNDIEASIYFIGLSYFKLEKYEEAIKYFENKFTIQDYLLDSQCFLGICKIVIGEKENGIKVLEETIKHERNNFAFRNAMLNLAVNTKDDVKAVNLLTKLFDSTLKITDEQEEVEEGELNRLRTLSLYYQANICLKNNNHEEALIRINDAIKFGDLSDSLGLNHLKYELSEAKDESIKNLIVNTIIDNNLSLDNKIGYPINFNLKSLYSYLDFVFDISDTALFENLVAYSTLNLLPNSNKFELILAVISLKTENKSTLLQYLEGYKDEMSDDLLLNLYKELAIISTNERLKFYAYFFKYLVLFNKNTILKSDDIYIFTLGIQKNVEEGKVKEALDLCKIIEKRVNNIVDENLKFESVIIYFWLAIVYHNLLDKDNAIKYADITLNLIDNSAKTNTSVIDEKGINSIKEQLIQIKKGYIQTKFSRNDTVKVKYHDGRIVDTKFKRVEFDLKNKKCVMIYS
ncbi:tetratricopeptide repeat protein [Flavobacterium sp. DSR3-2]|uniref:tetratricopeptide repeat protein n=1 Tax=Flavobacterium sp. DSR3-2 TaxID=2804634 RepID=UPI003CED9464